MEDYTITSKKKLYGLIRFIMMIVVLFITITALSRNLAVQKNKEISKQVDAAIKAGDFNQLETIAKKNKVVFHPSHLNSAIDRNDKKTMDFILSHGLNINAAVDDTSFNTPLHYAVYYRVPKKGRKEPVTLETVAYLIDRGANIKVVNREKVTPLHIACRNEDVETARLLIDKGADVNVADMQKMTPLHIASLAGNLELVKLLVEKGADLQKKAGKEETPLMMATKNKHMEVVKYISGKTSATMPGDTNRSEQPVLPASSRDK